VEQAGWRGLQQNQRIAYDIVPGQRGKSEAANLREIAEGEAEAAPAPATSSDE
jgi:hypothetical protein